MGITEYRDKNQLFRNTALCSKGHSRKRSKIAREKNLGRKLVFCQETSSKKGRESAARNGSQKKMRSKAAYKNKKGLCDAQIVARLLVVKDMSGKKSIDKVTVGDIRKFDKKLRHVLVRRHGNTKEFVNKYGLQKTGRRNKRYEDVELIAELRKFVLRKKRMPVRDDFGRCNGLAHRTTFYKYFGSLRRAKMMAGLDQLLAEVK